MNHLQEQIQLVLPLTPCRPSQPHVQKTGAQAHSQEATVLCSTSWPYLQITGELKTGPGAAGDPFLGEGATQMPTVCH